MLERKYRIPSASDVESDQSFREGVSILLLKPEVGYLGEAERNQLAQLLESHFSACGEPLCVLPLSLDKETARELWQRDVGHFLWAESYYEHMSSAPCIAIILGGRDSAYDLKRAIRTEMSQSVSKISGILGCDFIPDIVHGSDPDDGLVELQTFIEVASRKS
jgi:hypothetical protein